MFYIPPQSEAGTKTALNELYSAIREQENAHPEAVLLVAGDFNAGKLKYVLPNLYQHVKCATRGKKTLDHMYSTHRDAYKTLRHQTFGKSDYNSILQIPAYKQILKQEATVTRQMKQMLSYRAVLLAQTGICSGIPPMPLRNIPHQSLASSISASMKSSPQ